MFAMKIFPKSFSFAVTAVFFLSSFGLARATQVTAGSNVQLSVTADGTPPFTYQWTKNSSNLVGSTGPTLSIANIQSADAGSYAVINHGTAGFDAAHDAVIKLANAAALHASDFIV